MPVCCSCVNIVSFTPWPLLARDRAAVILGGRLQGAEKWAPKWICELKKEDFFQCIEATENSIHNCDCSWSLWFLLGECCSYSPKTPQPNTATLADLNNGTHAVSPTTFCIVSMSGEDTACRSGKEARLYGGIWNERTVTDRATAWVASTSDIARSRALGLRGN